MILLKGNLSEASREKLEVGLLVGSTQWQTLRDQVVNAALFTSKCDVLPDLGAAVVGKEGEFNSAMSQFEELLVGENFVNDDVVEEAVAEINKILPLWETLTDILLGIEASSLLVSVTS